MPLLGRRRERAALERFLGAARTGHGGTLVVRGEPGIGKTALLDSALDAAQGFQHLRATGVESEIELAYAALLQLCAPLLSRVDELAEPQRDAISVAFGRSSGSAPNPFMVGLATTTLLADAAVERPILAVLDDAQWLDRASTQALAFVGRRIAETRVALLIATREPGRELAGLPELAVAPLDPRESRTLLESVLHAPIDDQILDRIALETGGNPLALLELPRGLTPNELAGGFALPAAVPLHSRIEGRFVARVARLPRDARRLLLVAAADTTGNAALLWRAATELGIPESAAAAAASSGLIAFDDGVTFRHPLVRSAVYRRASAEERVEVHRALANATDSEADPDRRAWHRAQATLLPDEEVAAELERSAERARARGGFAAAGAFLSRSASLSLDPTLRAQRALSAAEARQRAGDLRGAMAMLDAPELRPVGELQQARADVLRGRVSFAADRGREAPALFLDAARRLVLLDPQLAREVYLDALTAAVFSGRLAGRPDAREVATAALALPEPPPPRSAIDLLLEGLALLITKGPAAGTPRVRDALDAVSVTATPAPSDLRRLWLAGRTAGSIWDYERWDSLTARQVQVARESGALAELALALSTRVGVQLFRGSLREAEILVAEADSLGEASDPRIVPVYGHLSLAAFQGSRADVDRLVESSVRDFAVRGEGLGLTFTGWVRAVLANGMARYDEAFEAARFATVNPREPWFATLALVELVEAAARSGHAERAHQAFGRLRESTQASGTAWATGIEARSRALLSEGDEAEGLYRGAIEALEPTPLRVDLARTRLLFGEWLRRQGRRMDAREELRQAGAMFDEFGLGAFAERARVELEATGGRARKRAIETADQLTPQEAQVSRLASLGNTNREIAKQLFISPSTVEYHLRKVFRKLDVKTRTQLVRRLQQPVDGLGSGVAPAVGFEPTTMRLTAARSTTELRRNGSREG